MDKLGFWGSSDLGGMFQKLGDSRGQVEGNSCAFCCGHTTVFSVVPVLPTGRGKRVIPASTSYPKMIAGRNWRGFVAISRLDGCISFMVLVTGGGAQAPALCALALALIACPCAPPPYPLPRPIATIKGNQRTGALPAVATLRLPSASLTQLGFPWIPIDIPS